MLFIGNGNVITRNAEQPFIKSGAVVIDDQGLIAAVGLEEILSKQYSTENYIDADQGLIMPGMINMHHHIYSAFARGLSMSNYSPKGFLDILEGMWWRLDRKLTLEDTYHSAVATYLECIRNGVTTVFDHHASFGAIEDSLNRISQVADLMGIRTCLCYEVSDRDGEEKCSRAIKENADFMRKVAKRTDDMQYGMMGMHAAFTLSDQTLDRCLEAIPGDEGCHIHVAEGLEDTYHSLQTYGKSVVCRLRDKGILGRRTIAAHSIHLGWEDVQILKETDTMVIHNPESNMGNAVGCANISEYHKAGLSLGLGTDGYTSDMLESYKVANILAKHKSGDPAVGMDEASWMLFENNAALANRYFKTPLGVLQNGAAGDVVILDYVPFTPMDETNLNGHLLFGACGRSVKTTIVAGKVLMKDREFINVDEHKLLSDARQQAGDLWKRVNEI